MSLFGNYIEESYDDSISEVSVYNSDNQIINEFTVYTTHSLSIHVDPTDTEPGFKNRPYIKVCDGPDYKRCKSIARIHLDNGGIMYNHKNRTGGRKEKLKITNSLGNKLNQIMRTKTTFPAYDNNGNRIDDECTVYECIWKYIYAKFPDATYYPCPDFTKTFVEQE